MRSARSNGRRTLFGERRRAPSAIAAAPPVQGLRQVVRPRGRRVRPLHVQASPQGQAVRDVRIPRVRRAGGAGATGEVVEGTRTRRLDERDIDAAIALTDLEAWGYTREDFRRLLALSPDGCFAAERDGRVVGVLTTTTYDGLAFLGAVIVAPELRGKGVGKEMMEAALAHLLATGVRTVRLNAYLNAIPFYERLGFHREYEVIRWHGPSTAGQPVRRIRPIRAEDLTGLARMDATYFGANRHVLLARLAEQFSGTFLVAEHLGRRGPGERLKATHSFSRAMTEKRVLALLAMLIGLIAGLLILVNALDIGRSNLSLSQVLNAGIAALLGIAILVGSLLIYRGKYSSGGIINILLGIVALILSISTTGSILAIVSGVIGLVATEAGHP